MTIETPTLSASSEVAPTGSPAQTSEFAWMDTPETAKRVKSGGKLTEEQKRFKSMARTSVTGRQRVWACDGEYVAVRLNTANPHTRERHQRFLDAGHYEHVETQDDVQVFRLLNGSPFKRGTPLLVDGLPLLDVKRQAVQAACRRDWVCYLDIIEELATRYKNQYDPAFAKLCFDETLERMMITIAMSGGPSAVEVSAGMSNVRKKRGYESKRVIIPGRGVKR